MLHGCRQNPDDFAAGTRMNELAQAHGIVVLYPGQVPKANQLGCWNWFHEQNQRRDEGEPSIIADMTRHIVETQRIDPRRVYIAGLSAGGAMAAVLAATYPDLYAAVGIHSGLPHAAANNLVSALSAMRHGPLGRPEDTPRAERQPVPTIVFHGDEDTTVHPDNGDEVIVQARWGREAQEDRRDGSTGMTVEHAEVPGGRTYTRTIHRDADGRCDAEHWLVHRAGHAWSGGSAIGSYTDPLGPDASVQMLRFFIEHPRK
jgi:poly(hydroxyalkanoate) depolymerase family esterase